MSAEARRCRRRGGYPEATIALPRSVLALASVRVLTIIGGLRKNETEAEELQTKAQELLHQSEERLHEGEHHEHRHHRLTFGATPLQIAIAIATISIITGGQR